MERVDASRTKEVIPPERDTATFPRRYMIPRHMRTANLTVTADALL